MNRLYVLAFMVNGLVATLGYCQDDKKEFKPTPPAKKAADKGAVSVIPAAPMIPGDAELHFLNGSTVRMIVKSEVIDVNTKYGTLKIPVRDVRAIDFGIHFPEGMEAAVSKAIEELGSSDYASREKAAKDLLASGPFAYPALIEATQSKELETQRRAKDLVKALQKNHPKKDLKLDAEDRIVTPTFTVAGKILTKELRAESEYFGEVKLTLAKLRTLKAMGAAGAETDIVVDGALYATQDSWMETEFYHNGKSTLQITAKGVIDLFPQGNVGAQQMAGPAGLNQNRVMAFGGGIRKVAGGRIGPQQAGVLFGKIGDTGEPFIVGERFEAAPEQEGKLFLTIGPSPWMCQCLGTYEVKIVRK